MILAHQFNLTKLLFFIVFMLSVAPYAQATLIQEGEEGLLIGNFVVGNDGSASGGQFVHVPNGVGGSSNPDPANRVDFTVDIPQSGLYRVEARVLAASGNDNSFFFGVDGDVSNAFRWNIPFSTTNIIYRTDNVAGSGEDPFLFNLSAGVHTLNLYVREDGARLDRFEVILVQAAGGNQSPSVTSPGNQTNTVGDSVNLGIIASDPENDVLTYSESGLPTGLSLNPVSGLITGSPSQVGSFSVTVSVDDGNGGTDSTNFTWVIEDNAPPPPPPPAGGLIQEGEDGLLIGNFVVGNDGSASGGQFVHVPNGVGGSSNPDPANRVDFTVDIPQSGLYRVEARVLAASGLDNSFFFGVDGIVSSAFRWNIPVSSNGTYRTDNVAGSGQDPFLFNLSAGVHTLNLYVREDGARLDRFEVILVQADEGNGQVGLFNEALYSQVAVSSSLNLASQFEATDAILDNGWIATDANPSIELQFDNPINLSQLSLYDLPSLSDQVTNASISFRLNGIATGTVIQTGALPDNGDVLDIPITPQLTVDAVQVSIDSFNGAAGLAEIQAFSSLPGNQAILFEDYFNNGSLGASAPSVGVWSQVDECANRPENWQELTTPLTDGINNALLQNLRCFDNDEANSVITGTYRFINTTPSDFDLRVRMRSATGDNTILDTSEFRGFMGVIFNRTNNNNYYRYEIDRRGGERNLLRKDGGVFTQLSTSSLSYPLDRWINIRIVRQNGVIVVFQDGEQVLSAPDSGETGDGIGLFCAKNLNCLFDNLTVLSVTPEPVLGLTSPVEFSVEGDGVIDAEAIVTLGTNVIGGVEFVLNEGQPNEASALDVDGLPPYTQSFVVGSTSANHIVSAYALDFNGISRLTNFEASDESGAIGVNGITFLVSGDSITEGIRDSIVTDDLATVGVNAGRNESSGYDPLLLDLLSEDNPDLTISVLSDSYASEDIVSASTRLPLALPRHPDVDIVLLKIGTNNLSGGNQLQSGLGSPANPVNPSTYKDYLQVMIDETLSQGIKVMLASPMSSLSDNNAVNLAAEFRSAVTELVVENANPNVLLGPDLYQRLTVNELNGLNFPSLYSVDGLHPNGDGYVEMANQWCQSLNSILIDNVTIACSP